MSNAPEGAQFSDDGQWWWDGQQWQAVSQGGGPTGGSSEAGDDRSAARVNQGMPASIYDLTDEQRSGFIGEGTAEVEVVSADEVDVVAMQDAGSDNGEAMA